eukprot:645220-Pyramimonas_sp.AAC.1
MVIPAHPLPRRIVRTEWSVLGSLRVRSTLSEPWTPLDARSGQLPEATRCTYASMLRRTSVDL